MKAFDNYEIWWVTGAQLLYGGDAVVSLLTDTPRKWWKVLITVETFL